MLAKKYLNFRPISITASLYNKAIFIVDYCTALFKIAALILVLSVPNLAVANWSSSFKQDLLGGTAIVADPNGKILWQHNAKQQYVPASIIKIATASVALATLGENYRFKTEFYLTPNQGLGIKGYGDPTFVSEALTESVAAIAPKLPTTLQSFVLDTTYFAKQLSVHGLGNSNNPYDATNGALIANFNTLYIHRKHNKKVVSAEPQTPLTATAKRLAAPFPTGKHRINVGHDIRVSLQNLSELLQIMLADHQITIPARYINKAIPKGSKLIHTHYSEPLSKIVKGLLKYSNNFTANQILLTLSAEQLSPPATLDKAKQLLQTYIKQQTTGNVSIEEGSGLSRKNKITATDMLALVMDFTPHYALLKQEGRIWAKTGTLSGVQTYAGFMQADDKTLYPFVIMLNKQRPFNYRKVLAKRLYQQFIPSPNSP